jgi:flagellar biosynthesis/type III secretory pathway M-ring protein FliF/YscJ
MQLLQFQINEMNITDEKLVTFLIWMNIMLLAIIIVYVAVRVFRPLISKRLSKIKEESEIRPVMSEETETGADDAAKAAIAAALYLYFNEMHDEESDIITVKRVSKTYSPWSSKLYSMRNLR